MDALLHIIFSIIDWLLGFLPEATVETLCNNVLEIYGYGVYILGSEFFSTFINIVISELLGTTVFYMILWLVNLVRGSGA